MKAENHFGKDLFDFYLDLHTNAMYKAAHPLYFKLISLSSFPSLF